MTTYQELLPIRERLNDLYKGYTIPKTNFVVRDFVILPDDAYDSTTYKDVIYTHKIGVPFREIEKAVRNHPYLNIRVLLKNKDKNKFYSLEELGFKIYGIENLKFGMGPWSSYASEKYAALIDTDWRSK
jgi:hypothetical protein